MTKPTTTSAAEQYTDELRAHVPGLAVSTLPRVFIVPCKPKGAQVVDLGRMWREPERWPEARTKLVDPFHYGPGLVPSVPKAWSFATVAERLVPERFDLPNPRWYTLSGEHLPWDHLPGQVGKALAASFEAMLVDVWHSSPANTKDAEVVACLEHHRRKGGNAQALTFHVESLVDRWRRTPPTRPDAVRLARVEVAGAGQLTKALEAWLATASKAPATSATPMAKSAAPVRTLAERLDAKPGARAAFDEMLQADGFTDASKVYVRKGRKGKGPLLATWEAVAAHFMLEGFGNDGKGLAAALMEYLPGLSIGQPRKLRSTFDYRDQKTTCERYLRESAKRHVRAHSGAAE
jgi:hypothetical protein